MHKENNTQQGENNMGGTRTVLIGGLIALILILVLYSSSAITQNYTIPDEVKYVITVVREGGIFGPSINKYYVEEYELDGSVLTAERYWDDDTWYVWTKHGRLEINDNYTIKEVK